MNADDDKLLTVNEAAQILGVSATTVRNWAGEGRLEARRTAGGHRRFPERDVRRLAAELAPAGKPRVLVVDDDEAIRYVLREAFTGAGFDVVEAETGLLGLNALDEHPPAVMLLDIMMPGIDGLQVMRHLGQFGVKVPVVAMSALGPDVERRVQELGADDFFAKPFELGKVVRRCRELAEEAGRVSPAAG